MARAKRHYIPGQIWHTPVKLASYLTEVGSKGFVDRVKSILGALALERKRIGAGEAYQLREPSIPYSDHFGGKKGNIGP